MSLLKNNGNCLLPCWWGITPGVTKWAVANQFLATFAKSITQGGIYEVPQDQGVYLATNYAVDTVLGTSPQETHVIYEVIDGVVDLIYVYPDGTFWHFQLNQILTTYGKPSEVWVDAEPGSPAGDVFHLYVFYRLQGFIANYDDYPMTKSGNILRSCPNSSGPTLKLWVPGQRQTFYSAEWGPGTSAGPSYARPLEVATGMTIDTFFQTFKTLDTSQCLKAPVDIWSNLYQPD